MQPPASAFLKGKAKKGLFIVINGATYNGGTVSFLSHSVQPLQESWLMKPVLGKCVLLLPLTERDGGAYFQPALKFQSSNFIQPLKFRMKHLSK